MKVTVVTPLYRVHNVEAIYANLTAALVGHDWQWLVVLDETSPEAPEIEGFEILTLRGLVRTSLDRDLREAVQRVGGIAREIHPLADRDGLL